MLTKLRRNVFFLLLTAALAAIARGGQAAENDPFQVPDGDVAELVRFVKSLQSFRPSSAQEFRDYGEKGPRALREAAERILAKEGQADSEAARLARVVLLEQRIREAATSEPAQQQRTFEDLKSLLLKKKEQGLSPKDLSLAMTLARALENAGSDELAAEAYQQFASLFGESKDESLRKMVEIMQGSARRLTLLGKPLELKGNRLDGTPLDWKSYRGKVVLVDFWATWCGPCLAEIPNVKRLYELYQERGFDVVGISLDRSREALERFLQREKLPWPTLHAEDESGQHPMATYYGIVAIPTVLLVDKEGKVVSLNARGDELKRLLEELLGPPPVPPPPIEIIVPTPRLTIEGHEDQATYVTFSPDGKTIATASDDRTARLWDAETGELLRSFEGHNGAVIWVDFSPDGKTLVSASWDGSIKLWEVETGRELRTLSGHRGPVWSVRFLPEGRKLASGSYDQTIRLWNVETGETDSILEGHTNRIYGIALSPDGKTLASASWDRTVRLWDMATGKQKQCLEGHTNYCLAVALSSDGKTVASSGEDRKIKLWDAASGELRQTLPGHDASIWALAFFPEKNLLASGGWHDAAIKLWDPGTGRVLQTVNAHTQPVRSLTVSPDGKTLASASHDCTIKLFDVKEGVPSGDEPSKTPDKEAEVPSAPVRNATAIPRPGRINP